MDVDGESRVSVAVRSRTKPDERPSLVAGKPPQKSKLIFPAAFIPFHSGPRTSRSIRDCRAEAAKLPFESPDRLGRANLGRSRLSTDPRVLNAFINARPDSRTLYLELLSTLL